MPTNFDPWENHLSAEPKHLKWPASVPWKSPTKRVYQQDQSELFEEQGKIKSLDNIYSKLTHPGYTFQKNEDYVTLYHLETNVLNVSEVTDCVQVKGNLHLNLFYKDSPLPLPQWFCHGRDCCLTGKRMKQNLPNYIRS